MSFLRPAAASCSRPLPLLAGAPAHRALSVAAPARAPGAVAGGKGRAAGPFDFSKTRPFEFDDTTSLGYLRLLEIDDVRELVSKMELDRKTLNAQARKFVPPKGTIRVTSQVDLTDPTSEYGNKRVLIAPLAALPLQGADAIQRFKLLAGPRWTPGAPGRAELGTDASSAVTTADSKNKDGYFKMTEDRYPDGRMNRKALSDTLERLVAAANDPKSPLSPSTPVDTSHLLSRQRKKRSRTMQRNHKRAEALKARSEVVGGVRGFPKEWLAPEQQKASVGKQQQ